MPSLSRRFLTRALLAAVLGLTAALAAACGTTRTGKGLLSPAESRTIVSALNSVSTAVHEHSCSRAQTAVHALDAALQNLSSETSSSLQQNLGHGATTVSQLALTQCRPTHTRTTSTSSSTTNSSTSTSASVTQTSTTQSTTSSTPSVPTTSSTPQTSTNPATQTTGSGNGGGGGGGGGGAGLSGGGSQ